MYSERKLYDRSSTNKNEINNGINKHEYIKTFYSLIYFYYFVSFSVSTLASSFSYASLNANLIRSILRFIEKKKYAKFMLTYTIEKEINAPKSDMKV